MTARHSSFPLFQRRLRRLNPAWYDPSKPIDDEFGEGMEFGFDAALDELERQRNLGPLVVPSSPASPSTPPAGAPAGMPRGMDRKFGFLFQTPIPPLMVRVALAEFGTLETPGTADNPKIIGWADEVADVAPSAYNRWAADFYNDDSIPWCGLFMAMVAVRSFQGRPERLPPNKYLSAREWANFGVAVEKQHAAVGDVMVMSRSGGGHVTLNVGTEKGERRFFGLGANQSDAVNIMPFELSRVIAVRRPPYNALPPGARRVILSAGGASSTREA